MSPLTDTTKDHTFQNHAFWRGQQIVNDPWKWGQYECTRGSIISGNQQEHQGAETGISGVGNKRVTSKRNP
jgi:hypothetical protein